MPVILSPKVQKVWVMRPYNYHFLTITSITDDIYYITFTFIAFRGYFLVVKKSHRKCPTAQYMTRTKTVPIL